MAESGGRGRFPWELWAFPFLVAACLGLGALLLYFELERARGLPPPDLPSQPAADQVDSSTGE
jgi:hypothetical protein